MVPIQELPEDYQCSLNQYLGSDANASAWSLLPIESMCIESAKGIKRNATRRALARVGILFFELFVKFGTSLLHRSVLFL